MHKLAIIGDIDSIYGFGALGIEVFPVLSSDEALKKIKEISCETYAIIYIIEQFAHEILDEINILNKNTESAIVIIPGIKENLNLGNLNLKSMVEKAVGSDIL